MPWKWVVIIGIAIGLLITCWMFRYLEYADVQVDNMTAYEHILKNPTGAGRK